MVNAAAAPQSVALLRLKITDKFDARLTPFDTLTVPISTRCHSAANTILGTLKLIEVFATIVEVSIKYYVPEDNGVISI